MDLTTLKQRFNIIGNNPALNEALEVAVRVGLRASRILQK